MSIDGYRLGLTQTAHFSVVLHKIFRAVRKSPRLLQEVVTFLKKSNNLVDSVGNTQGTILLALIT